jgi:hypothetical protein
MTAQYQWGDGRERPVSAQIIGEQLAILREKLGRDPTAAEVVDAARDPDSPLHPLFEWDDKKAARSFYEQN